jgi:hypothetical protein
MVLPLFALALVGAGMAAPAPAPTENLPLDGPSFSPDPAVYLTVPMPEEVYTIQTEVPLTLTVPFPPAAATTTDEGVATTSLPRFVKTMTAPPTATDEVVANADMPHTLPTMVERGETSTIMRLPPWWRHCTGFPMEWRTVSSMTEEPTFSILPVTTKETGDLLVPVVPASTTEQLFSIQKDPPVPTASGSLEKRLQLPGGMNVKTVITVNGDLWCVYRDASTGESIVHEKACPGDNYNAGRLEDLFRGVAPITVTSSSTSTAAETSIMSVESQTETAGVTSSATSSANANTTSVPGSTSSATATATEKKLKPYQGSVVYEDCSIRCHPAQPQWYRGRGGFAELHGTGGPALPEQEGPCDGDADRPELLKEVVKCQENRITCLVEANEGPKKGEQRCLTAGRKSISLSTASAEPTSTSTTSTEPTFTILGNMPTRARHSGVPASTEASATQETDETEGTTVPTSTLTALATSPSRETT